MMSIESSKFDLGPLGKIVNVVNEKGYERIVGEHGVFATRMSNGATFGVPNSGAPSTKVPALTRDGDLHNQRTREYFLAAGLPSDQIAGVHVSTLMEGGGPVGDFRPKLGKFVAFTSNVDRAVDGIPIADSLAFARFNAQDQVVEEGVFWPDVPQSVLDEAAGVKRVLSDPTQREVYLSKLPSSIRNLDGQVVDSQVVVHHSSWTVDSPPSFYACYDVTESVGSGMALIRHFDVRGNEVRLPQELEEISLAPRPERLP
jgi:hypothetical protein